MEKEVKKEEEKKIEEASEYSKTKKSLSYAIADGSAHASMQGFGSTYIAPFAIALKASNTAIAMISTLPELVGSFSQLLSSALVEKFKSRKKIIMFLALLQSLLWIPLLMIPFVIKDKGPVVLLGFVTLFGVISFIINPLWNSWMGDLVPEDARGRYFGKRNTITSIIVFISTFAAGYILSVFEKSNIFFGFAILFIIAFVSRVISVVYLAQMHEPEYIVDKKAYFSLFEFFARLKRKDNYYGKFVIYMCILGFAVSIAGPFFTVYMLKDLKFDYITFTIISLSSIVASFLSMNFWGRINDAKGSRFVMFVTGFLISSVPLLWLLTKSPTVLFFVEIYSGIVWAGFNLASANFIFDATTPQKRTRCIAYYNVLHGTCVFAGAILGGWMSEILPHGKFLSAIPALFIISGALRLLSAIVFLPMLKEMRLIEVPVGHSIFSSITIKPRRVDFEPIGIYEKKKKRKIKEERKENQNTSRRKLVITQKEKEMITRKKKEELLKGVESVEKKLKK